MAVLAPRAFQTDGASFEGLRQQRRLDRFLHLSGLQPVHYVLLKRRQRVSPVQTIENKLIWSIFLIIFSK